MSIASVLSRVVDLYDGANEESWLVGYEDGGIKRHKENDGYRAMKHGLEPEDRWIDIEEVARLSWRYPAPHRGTLLARVTTAFVQVLAELRGRIKP